ncbi:hypothetical protein L596_019307 [Steinernema carpocapsae]|uniref:Uncharacterized protein n=1 Tax=Steinernema carpocapsae TaxID=34508 RepID=A0A4U5MQ64_STECR|nr:hypothetical protein L596_019307 [Steinernema carpocapsae]
MLSLPRGRLALGIGVAVGVAAVASTLLFYSFSVRRRRAKQESTTRFATVPEKVNADGKEKPKLLVIKKSKTAADKKKKGSSRKKKGSSRKTKKDSKRDRESIRSPSIHVPTNLISCDCRTDKNMEITPADSEGFDIGTDEFNVDLLLPNARRSAMRNTSRLTGSISLMKIRKRTWTSLCSRIAIR